MELARSKILTTSCKKGEGGSSRPKIREGAGLKKIFFGPSSLSLV